MTDPAVVKLETRLCLNCGATNELCPPSMTRCRFCKGPLGTPLSEWVT
jgi:ribosomal protein L40E